MPPADHPLFGATAPDFIFDPAAVEFPAASPLLGSGSSAFSDPCSSSKSSPDPADRDSEPPQAGPSGASAAAANRKRIRPKIDLAPGQPPTARGNPRIRVFVACYQW